MLKRDFSDIVYRALANYFDVQVINSNIRRQGRKIVVVDNTRTGTVLSGQVETVLIIPPVGKIYKLRQIHATIAPPAGATTGTHTVALWHPRGKLYGLKATNSYTGTIKFTNAWAENNTTLAPSDPAAFLLSFENLLYSNSIPAKVDYVNGTDADQTNDRVIEFIFEEFDELS